MEVTFPKGLTVKLSFTVPSCPARLALLGYFGDGRLRALGVLTIRFASAALVCAAAFALAVARFLAAAACSAFFCCWRFTSARFLASWRWRAISSVRLRSCCSAFCFSLRRMAGSIFSFGKEGASATFWEGVLSGGDGDGDGLVWGGGSVRAGVFSRGGIFSAGVFWTIFSVGGVRSIRLRLMSSGFLSGGGERGMEKWPQVSAAA